MENFNKIYLAEKYNFIPLVGPRLCLQHCQDLGTLRSFQELVKRMMEVHPSAVLNQHSLSVSTI